MPQTVYDNKLPNRLEMELASNNVIPKVEENYIRILHCVNPGDLIAAMGAIKKFYELTKRKAIVYQSIATNAAYYPGAVHPTVNSLGENVCCNQQMFDMLKPLVEEQEYIHSFEVYEGQKVDIDFNVIRGKTFVNLPNGSIQGWIPLAFPDLIFDISKEWITVSGECPEHIKSQVDKKIVLNFTERYRNQITDYFFLKNYAPDLIFAGTPTEHFKFCDRWQLNMPRLEVNDFLEYTHAIKNSRFFLSNQSFGWNLCQSIQHPRILELCQYAQNCIFGIGEHSYGFLHQAGLEFHFRRLYNIL